MPATTQNVFCIGNKVCYTGRISVIFQIECNINKEDWCIYFDLIICRRCERCHFSGRENFSTVVLYPLGIIFLSANESPPFSTSTTSTT